MKYVVAQDYYSNCRSHDNGHYHGLVFFKNLKEILTYALENKNDYELKEVYSCNTGNKLFEIDYYLGAHSCNGVGFKHKNFYIRTEDDGHGKLVWVRK